MKVELTKEELQQAVKAWFAERLGPVRIDSFEVSGYNDRYPLKVTVSSPSSPLDPVVEREKPEIEAAPLEDKPLEEEA